MMQGKELFQLITRFLSRSENIGERKQLFDWFDQQVFEQIPEESFSEIQQKTKDRLFADIETRKKSGFIRQLRYIGTAAAILLIGIFVYRYWFPTEHLASDTVLASIAPGKERAIITLADGTQINLDKIPLRQHIKFGDIILTKDAHGRISYSNAITGKTTIQQNSLITPKGATYEVTLADGTVVSLNADSKLTYPSSFEKGDRVVELEGEAYFNVHKTSDKSQFIVKSRLQQTRVLGTKFNINAYPENAKIRTSLEEGQVIVSKESHVIKLKPNEQAVLENGRLSTQTINIEDVLSWKNGQFYFDGTNTTEVLQQIARWYDITITYKPNGDKEQYTGKIPKNISLDKLIKLLNYADLKTKAILGRDNKVNLIIT